MAERKTEIKAGEYILKIDSFCMWIEKARKVTKGQNAGVEYSTRVTGYFQNFEELLKNFAAKRVKDADAKTMQEMLSHMAAVEQELLGLAKKIGSELDGRYIGEKR